MEVVEAGEAVPIMDAVRHDRADRCRCTMLCGHSARHIGGRSSWMPGVFGSNGVRELPCLFQAMAHEGLQGGKSDQHEVAQPQHIHAPGIQPEPRARGIPQVFTVDWRTSRIER